MTTQSLFRVLSQYPESKEFLVQELTETTDGTTVATGTAPIRVSSESDVDDVEFTLSLLSPGHLLYATLEGTEPYDVVDIEHRGGVTFELLNLWLPPYLAMDIWRDYEEDKSETQQGQIVQPIESEEDIDPLSPSDPIGESTLVFTDESDLLVSQEVFHQRRNIESFLQEFQDLPGEPMEVLAADPYGVPFWCVLAFDSEDSSIAQKIKSQYGSCQNGEFISNPLFSIRDSTGHAQKPTNPENPRQVIGEDYQDIPAEMIPDKTGRATIELIRELITMSKGFSLNGLVEYMSLGEGDSSLSLEDVNTLSGDQYSDAIETIGDAFIGYIRITMQIYEIVSSASVSDPKKLLNQGNIPDPEILDRAEKIFNQYFALHHGFNRKIENINIREYVPDMLSHMDKSARRKFKKQQPHFDPIPDELENLATQQRDTLDTFKTTINECKTIVNINTTGSETQYDLPVVSNQSTNKYKEFKQIRDEGDTALDQIPEEFKNEGWRNAKLLENFSIVDINKGKGGCQARFEWLGEPEINFRSFRTI